MIDILYSIRINCTYRLDGDLSCGFICTSRVLKHHLVLAHIIHDAGRDEEGGVGAVEGDHVPVPGLDDLVIEVPCHLDLSLLVILLESAFELKTLSFFFDLECMDYELRSRPHFLSNTYEILQERGNFRLDDFLLNLLLFLLLDHLLFLLFDRGLLGGCDGVHRIGGALRGLHLDGLLVQRHGLGLGLSGLAPGHQLVAALVSDLGVLDLQLDDRLAVSDLGLLLLDGVPAALFGGDLLALLEPLDVNVLGALDGALKHDRLLLLDLLDDRPLADHGGHLDVEGQVGVDLTVFVADDTFV